MARSQSERIEEIVPRKETNVKKKLIDRINALGSDATTTAKELTYLSKSLEVLNKQIKTDTFTGGSGPEDYGKRPALQEEPHASMPSWNVGRGTMGRNSSPAQFGIYGSNSHSAGLVTYNEQSDAVVANRWQWCHHNGGGNGGSYGPWSTGQRNNNAAWNTNNCYYGSMAYTHTGYCHNNGADSVGPLGHSGLVTGPGQALARRHWCTGESNQATGISCVSEYRNEQVETGNCEPTDKYTYLIYQNSTIRLRNRRILPGAVTDYSQKPTVNGDTNSFGSLTHNFFRKELAVLNRDSTILDQQGDGGYHFKTKIYKNVPDINLQTDLGLVLNDATAKTITSRIEDGGDQGVIGGITRDPSGITMEYDTNDRSVFAEKLFENAGRLEGREGTKMVMVDNGDIYWSVTCTNSHSLHKCTRYTVDGVTDDDYFDWGFVPTYSKVAAMRGYKDQDEFLNEDVIGYDRRPEVVDYHQLSDFRGRDTAYATQHANGVTWGCSHVGIPSRNNKNVILQCAYYHYGAGSSSWLIDKRFSRWQTACYFRDTGYGVQWGPFGEEGFVCNYARNGDGADADYRLYLMRQDLNTGIWQRSDMSRAMNERVPATTVYPTLVPIY